MARTLDQIAISAQELAPFLSGKPKASQAEALLEQQKRTWEMLRNGYDTLRTVRTRVFDFDGFQIKVQFNPGRLISTVAKVDAASIKERKCFLCTENLPPAQRGIPYDGGTSCSAIRSRSSPSTSRSPRCAIPPSLFMIPLPRCSTSRATWARVTPRCITAEMRRLRPRPPALPGRQPVLSAD